MSAVLYFLNWSSFFKLKVKTLNANVELVPYEEYVWGFGTDVLYDGGIAFISQQGIYEYNEEGYQLLLDVCIDVDETPDGVIIDIFHPKRKLADPSIIRFSSELEDELRRSKLPDAYLAAAEYLISIYPKRKKTALGILAGVYGLTILIDDRDIAFHHYGAQVEEMYEVMTA